MGCQVMLQDLEMGRFASNRVRWDIRERCGENEPLQR